MVICLERGANLHAAHLMPLPLTVSCSSKIQIGFNFLVPAHPGRPGQRAIKRVCVFVCVCVCMCASVFLLPISVRFRYHDHLVANRMASSMCPDPCGTRWDSWFSSSSLPHLGMIGVYAIRIFFKMPHKADIAMQYRLLVNEAGA